jgi:hypothetical protein
MGRIGCAGTSVTDYQSTPRIIPEEHTLYNADVLNFHSNTQINTKACVVAAVE